MMKLSALDIHQKEFGHAMRGYREEEVDDFLDLIANEIDRLSKENEELIGRIRFTESKLEGLDAERSAITETLINAQRNADELLRGAEEKAAATKLIAEDEAKGILAQAENTKREILSSLRKLKADEERFRASYTRLLEDSLAAVREIKLPESVQAEFEPKADSFAAAVARAEAENVAPVAEEAPVVEVAAVEAAEEAPAVEAPVAEPVLEEVAVEEVAEPEAAVVEEVAVEEVLVEEVYKAPVYAAAAEPEPFVAAPPVNHQSAYALDPEPEVPQSNSSVSGLIIGERESEGPIDVTLEEPRDFEIPGGYRWGERDDDLIIEEID